MSDRRCLAIEEQLLGGCFVVLEACKEIALAGFADPPRAWTGDRPPIVQRGVVRGNVGKCHQRVREDAAYCFLTGGSDGVESAPEMSRPPPSFFPVACLHVRKRARGATRAFANPRRVGVPGS